MLKLPLICANGIGDSFLILGRVPIGILGKLGFRFNIFYTTPEHPARKILEPFFCGIRYCDYLEREPSPCEKWVFSKMLSLSMRTAKIWRPPFEISGKEKRQGRKILLHTHLDGHHGWKGATAKIWPIANWIELCRGLHAEGWEISVLEWDESAWSELQNACGFLRDGRRRDLLETVQSFGEYDALFSIDSWSKYVGVWYGLKQVTCAADVRSGYCGNESTSAEKLANWWFHGVLNHAKVKVLGLEKSGNGYFYTYSQISEMGVRSAMDAIRSACRE